MANLLYWLATFIIGSLIARLATLVVFYVIGDGLITYMLDNMWAQLSGFGPVAVLQLAGVGDALSIIASGLLLKMLISRWSMGPGSAIIGGGS